ncbi:hypothetical protein [Alteromonas sp. ALT199]|uniref:hypothetical protein n=1 Tax=unclassified Alteromonas TaxID=2614992 RepID=UPI002037270A|nr:hypothetical protein [Alteromonas sp. ALT199]
MTSIKKLQQREFKSVLAVTPFTARKNDSSNSPPCIACNGGVLIEVLIALFIFMTSSTYLLSSEIKTRVLWQATLKSQGEQIQLLNTAKLALTQDNVEQRWEDIAVFGIPTITP